MKKTIMLTMIMALGITASAMAAPTASMKRRSHLLKLQWHACTQLLGMSLAILSLILIMIPCIKAAMVLMILLAMAAAVVNNWQPN